MVSLNAKILNSIMGNLPTVSPLGPTGPGRAWPISLPIAATNIMINITEMYPKYDWDPIKIYDLACSFALWTRAGNRGAREKRKNCSRR